MSVEVLEVLVRPALEEDHEILMRDFPRGHPETHLVRIRQTAANEGLYVVAWLGSKPVGHAYIRWTPARPFESDLPNTPTIQDVGVHQDWRMRGIASRMMDYLEGAALGRGFERVGLAVGVDNARARRLYERRGYIDTGLPANMETWTSMGADGREVVEGELCIYLVKELR